MADVRTDRGEETADADWWFDQFRSSMRVLDHMLFGSLVVDPATGRIIASNPRAAELLGGSVPDTVIELVDRGALSRPAYDELVEQAQRTDPASWTVPLTLHLDGERSELTLLAAAVHEPLVDATAIIALLTERGREQIYVEFSVPDGSPGQLFVFYDSYFRARAVDPRISAYLPPEDSELGALAWLVVHPADLWRVVPRFRELRAGDVASITYTARIRTPFGNWTPMRCEMRRMVTDIETPYLGVIDLGVHADFKDEIQPGVLTARELEIVKALFDARRIPQIAARSGVAEKTVRNQLSTIFRKLGVANQGALLDRYLRPG